MSQRAHHADRVRQLFHRLLPVIEYRVHGGGRRERDRRNHRPAIRNAATPPTYPISGSYQGGTIVAVLPSVTVEADSANPDGNGNFPLTYDTSGPGGPQQGLTLTATYSVDSTGRSPLTVNGSTAGIAYVVNPSKILVLSTDANPKVNSLEQ